MSSFWTLLFAVVLSCTSTTCSTIFKEPQTTLPSFSCVGSNLITWHTYFVLAWTARWPHLAWPGSRISQSLTPYQLSRSLPLCHVFTWDRFGTGGFFIFIFYFYQYPECLPPWVYWVLILMLLNMVVRLTFPWNTWSIWWFSLFSFHTINSLCTCHSFC